MLDRLAGRSRRRVALLSKAGLVSLAALGFIAVYVGILNLAGNFHQVIAGELYRSAQPTPEAIEDYARRYAIRTVVNLRGAKPGKSWYDREIAMTRRLGMAHLDFAMSSSRELKQADAARLVALLEKAPKPILIHCRGGADRTGLVAALYLAQVAKVGEAKAEGQLSLFFGHIGVPILSPAYEMDRTWEKLEPWLGFEQS